MAIFPVATAARMLGIHPKTLHHWLGQTNVPLVAHPTDARIKCVAQEHLWEVASRHGRPLAGLPSAPASRKEQAKPLFAHQPDPDHPTASSSAPSASLVDLIQRLSCLETKVAPLQEHLAQLALALLNARERTVEQRLAALEALISPLVGGQMLAHPQEQGARQEPAGVSKPGASASCGRTTGSVSHACFDRIRRARSLCDRQFTGRRVAAGAGFGGVVRVAGSHRLVPLCG